MASVKSGVLMFNPQDKQALDEATEQKRPKKYKRFSKRKIEFHHLEGLGDISKNINNGLEKDNSLPLTRSQSIILKNLTNEGIFLGDRPEEENKSFQCDKITDGSVDIKSKEITKQKLGKYFNESVEKPIVKKEIAKISSMKSNVIKPRLLSCRVCKMSYSLPYVFNNDLCNCQCFNCTGMLKSSGRTFCRYCRKDLKILEKEKRECHECKQIEIPCCIRICKNHLFCTRCSFYIAKSGKCSCCLTQISPEKLSVFENLCKELVN
jgi:hypothetical protein